MSKEIAEKVIKTVFPSDFESERNKINSIFDFADIADEIGLLSEDFDYTQELIYNDDYSCSEFQNDCSNTILDIFKATDIDSMLGFIDRAKKITMTAQNYFKKVIDNTWYEWKGWKYYPDNQSMYASIEERANVLQRIESELLDMEDIWEHDKKSFNKIHRNIDEACEEVSELYAWLKKLISMRDDLVPEYFEIIEIYLDELREQIKDAWNSNVSSTQLN